MSESWHSYPKVWNIGHAATKELFDGPVIVQEKIDGSQFSFGRFGGELRCKSKSSQLVVEAPEKMFSSAVNVASQLDLIDGWTYRGEYLQKPKHNTLAYDRTPIDHIILFDINIGHEEYLTVAGVQREAIRLGLESVPLLHEGIITAVSELLALLERTSILGGQKVEGVVVKNYAKFGPDGKALMGKYVREEFKELNRHDFRERNPLQNDILTRLVNTYKTSARWDKAIIHLREQGKLENSPRDIPLVMKEITRDLLEECKPEIEKELFAWAWKDLSRRLTAGAAEHYKKRLLENVLD